MKIFHLADLHLGKRLNQVELIEEQKVVLDEVLDYIDQEKPDVIVLAGDIYDRRNPSLEAMALCDEFLTRLIIEKKVKVVGIAGNHDSGKRLDYGKNLLSHAGLYLEGEFTYPIPEISLEDSYGEVVFHLLPFADLAMLCHRVPKLLGHTYDEAMKTLIEEMPLSDKKRHVLLAHGMVLGTKELEFSESERELSVGGTLAFSAKLLEKFDYVALGHLHKAQRVGQDYIRYSGSLYPYSFSEAGVQKEITMVELKAKGTIEITSLPLKKARQLEILRGTLNELLANDKPSDNYLKVELLDKNALIEPMKRLQEVYPHILQLVRVHDLASSSTYQTGDLQKKVVSSPYELFKEFYFQVKEEDMDQDKSVWLKKIIDEEQVT